MHFVKKYAKFFWLAVLALPVSMSAHAWESGYEVWPAPEWFVWEGSNYKATDESAFGANGFTVLCGTGDALEGDCALKAWVNTPYCNGTSCRAYPGMHAETPMPLIDVYWIKIDELDFAGNGWFSLFTHATVDWAVNTAAIVGDASNNYRLEMAHLPHQQVGYPEFPLGQWNRITTYLNWRPTGDGSVAVWINGVKTFEGVSGLEGNLPRGHYGAYTMNVERAVMWNDGHRICHLDGPLSDTVNEPKCPGSSEPMPPVLED